jgi:hypothetical protein
VKIKYNGDAVKIAVFNRACELTILSVLFELEALIPTMFEPIFSNNLSVAK